MKKFLLIVTFVFLFITTLLAPSSNLKTITLAWDVSCDTNVVGYILLYGSVGSPYRTNIVQTYTNSCNVVIQTSTNVYFGQYNITNRIIINGRTNASCTISNLVCGIPYSFVARAYDSFMLESDDSPELLYMIPIPVTNSVPSPPENFRIIDGQ